MSRIPLLPAALLILAAPMAANAQVGSAGLSASGGSGSNAAASATGSAVPASAGYTGYNSGGNLVGVSSANPMPVTDASVVAAIQAAALTTPLAITGTTTTAAQVTVTTGGTAQNLFSGVAPVNGYEVCDPNATGDLWLSETTTAAANAGYRVQANGGCYDSPTGSKPGGVVSVFGATTAMKITVKSW